VTRIALALLWHLHQPLYRLRGERVCFLPWVRLHAARSYYDMIRVLEEFPGIRVTFNLTATLIEQIRAYELGASDLFRETARITAEDLDDAQRAFLFENFFAAQAGQMIDPLPRFAELHALRERARRERGASAWKELTTADYRDLQVLFDLSWFGFKAREDFPEIRALIDRGRDFSARDVRAVHAVEDEILRRILGLYGAAAAQGRIEIATSPYAHPILPLLLDTDSAREAMPQAVLPPRLRAPDDARGQVEDALALVERELGSRPRGLWSSEGALSREAVELLSACGIDWTASDEQLLAASGPNRPVDAGRPWTQAGTSGAPVLLFRDHDLSDRIGFSYARADPGQAAEDFLAGVSQRAQPGGDGGRLLLVALDGENPWEHYSQAGGPFLRALYGGLSRHPEIDCETVSRAIARCPERGTLDRLRAGSWIHADFGTWIGGPEKNRAWGLIGAVRSLLQETTRDPRTAEEAKGAAWASLRAAEGSDWFWWMDGQFTTEYRTVFDETFRGHLRQACEALGRRAPESLGSPVTSSVPEQDEGGSGAPGILTAPRVDGYEGDVWEWRGARRIGWSALDSRATMQTAERPIESLRFGFTRAGLFCLRLDPDPRAGARRLAGLRLDLAFRVGERVRHLRLDLDERGDLRSSGLDKPAGASPAAPDVPCLSAAARAILELTVPCEVIGLEPGTTAGLRIGLQTSAGTTPLKEIAVRVPEFERGLAEPGA